MRRKGGGAGVGRDAGGAEKGRQWAGREAQVRHRAKRHGIRPSSSMEVLPAPAGPPARVGVHPLQSTGTIFDGAALIRSSRGERI